MNNSSDKNNFIRYGFAGLFFISIILFIIFNFWGQNIVEILNNNKTIDFLNRLAGHNLHTPEHVIKILVNMFFASIWILYLIILVIIYLIINLKDLIGKTKRNNYYDSLCILLFVLAGTVLLMWSALYNRYPLIYPDSGTYITSLRPVDRPVGYHLFILITTLGSSLWLVIFYQALITSFLIYRDSYLLLKKCNLCSIVNQLISFGILFLVVGITDISKYVSWLIPDIFTSWIFLGGMLYLLSSDWNDRLIAYIVISLAFLCHNSNILIIYLSISLLFVIGLIYRIKIQDIWKKSIKLVYVVILLTILACVLNFGLGFEFALSHNKANFIVSKFISTGVLSKTLNAYGPTKNWKFYKYKKDFDNAIGKPSDWFLWDKDSPIKKMGDWVWEDQREQNEIILYAFKNFTIDILKASVIDTVRELNCFDSNDGLGSYADSHWLVNKAIKIHYPNEYKSFINSRQQRGLKVAVSFFNIKGHFLPYTFLLITLFSIYLFIYKKDYILSVILGSSIIFVIINAISTGSLSAIVGRFNGRVFWVILYCLILTWASFIIRTKSTKNA